MKLKNKNLKEIWKVLNHNQKKVVLALYRKRQNDEYMREAYNGYMQIPHIVSYCNFQRNSTAVGCIQGLRVAGVVEMRTELGYDNISKKYYRLTDEFYEQLKEVVDKLVL